MFKFDSPRNKGQGLVEYALILILVSLAIVVVLSLTGPAISNVYGNIIYWLTTPLEQHGEEPPPPGDCYGSLLLTVMVGLTGVTMLISYILPKKFFDEPLPVVSN